MRELHAIVLASASPRRFELLSSLGVNVHVRISNVVEGDRPGYGPRELAELHAAAKAEAVAVDERGMLVVGADTVVDLDGVGLGKPADAGDAARMLSALSGRSHIVHTAYVAIATGRRIARTVSTTVWFSTVSPETIAAYIATGDPFDKAGSYGIAGRGAALVDRIAGDYHTVMGFPLGDFVRNLGGLGYTLPSAGVAAPGALS